MLQAIYKVPNGKLLKVFLAIEEDTIIDIKITGDFFLHPEEKITILEDALNGASLDKENLQKIIEATIADEEIELFGVDPESIVKTILAARSS